MAYRSIIQEVPGNLRRTILGTFDFRGRSTRTELLVFYVVSQVLGGLLVFPDFWPLAYLGFDTRQELGGAVTLALTVPLPALFARRAHDLNQTGWWALLLLVAIVLVALSDHGGLYMAGVAKVDLPIWLDAASILAIIGLWAISLLPPTPQANRYGPNPRLDEANSAS